MTPDFAWMMARHAQARTAYVRAAVALAAGGLATAGLGVVLPDAWDVLLAVGLFAASLAVVPLKEAIERGERAEGLAVLDEEWRDPALDESGRTRLAAVIARLYGRPRAE